MMAVEARNGVLRRPSACRFRNSSATTKYNVRHPWSVRPLHKTYEEKTYEETGAIGTGTIWTGTIWIWGGRILAIAW